MNPNIISGELPRPIARRAKLPHNRSVASYALDVRRDAFYVHVRIVYVPGDFIHNTAQPDSACEWAQRPGGIHRSCSQCHASTGEEFHFPERCQHPAVAFECCIAWSACRLHHIEVGRLYLFHYRVGSFPLLPPFC